MTFDVYKLSAWCAKYEPRFLISSRLFDFHDQTTQFKISSASISSATNSASKNLDQSNKRAGNIT